MSKLRVIVLNGYGGTGKDTFYGFCYNKIKATDSNAIVSHISMVDKAKYIAKMTGWDGGKSEKDRKYLAELKTLIDNYNDGSMGSIKQFIGSMNYKYGSRDRYIFVDSREPYDIDRLVADYGATTVFIINNNIPKVLSNHADANVEKYEYDYYIDNNSTLDNLENNANHFIETLMEVSNEL